MKVSTQDIRSLAAEQTALPSRLRYTGLLLVAAAGACVTAALLVTEASLPVRTQASMAVLLGINVAWAVFAVWVLARRRTLLASHSVVAARMAVAFSAVFVCGAAAVGYWGGGGRPMYLASLLGLAMLGVAAGLLVRARRRLDGLMRRRLELEEGIGGRRPVQSGRAG